MIKKGYSVLVTLRKGLITLALFGVPVLLDVLPEEWLNLTVGSLLVMVINFIKYNATLKR